MGSRFWNLPRNEDGTMKRVTIKDIAKIAGVSYATVSRALSDSPEISKETRERIKEICAREGYRPNTLARSLISNRTNVLGLIVPDISNAFYSEVAFSIETYARKRGYNVMLCNSLYDTQQVDDLFNFLLGHQVDGIILCNSRDHTRDSVARYFQAVPTVLFGDCNLDPVPSGCSAVCLDNFSGGYTGMRYLTGLGHTDVCYLGFRAHSSTHEHRLAGARRAAEEAGATLRVIENDSDFSTTESGYALAQSFFDAPHSSTAIFAATDSLALGVLQAADEAGVRIPEDFSLLGFDNCFYADLPKIKLTTVDQRKQQLAEAAVDLLLQLIDRRGEEPSGFTRRIIRPALVERSTCIPPREE